jgi:hypothetical protein
MLHLPISNWLHWIPFLLREDILISPPLACCCLCTRLSEPPFLPPLRLCQECVLVILNTSSHSFGLLGQLPYFVSEAARDAEDGFEPKSHRRLPASSPALPQVYPQRSRRPTRTIIVTPVETSALIGSTTADQSALSACRHALSSWPDDARPVRRTVMAARVL